MNAEQLLSNITNITIDGADLILDRVFDNVGFNRIEDVIFRKLVKARLSYPASKSATVEYLKNHFDDDVSLLEKPSAIRLEWSTKTCNSDIQIAS